MKPAIAAKEKGASTDVPKPMRRGKRIAAVKAEAAIAALANVGKRAFKAVVRGKKRSAPPPRKENASSNIPKRGAAKISKLDSFRVSRSRTRRAGKECCAARDNITDLVVGKLDAARRGRKCAPSPIKTKRAYSEKPVPSSSAKSSAAASRKRGNSTANNHPQRKRGLSAAHAIAQKKKRTDGNTTGAQENNVGVAERRIIGLESMALRRSARLTERELKNGRVLRSHANISVAGTPTLCNRHPETTQPATSAPATPRRRSIRRVLVEPALQPEMTRRSRKRNAPMANSAVVKKAGPWTRFRMQAQEDSGNDPSYPTTAAGHGVGPNLLNLAPEDQQLVTPLSAMPCSSSSHRSFAQSSVPQIDKLSKAGKNNVARKRSKAAEKVVAEVQSSRVDSKNALEEGRDGANQNSFAAGIGAEPTLRRLLLSNSEPVNVATVDEEPSTSGSAPPLVKPLTSSESHKDIVSKARSDEKQAQKKSESNGNDANHLTIVAQNGVEPTLLNFLPINSEPINVAPVTEEPSSSGSASPLVEPATETQSASKLGNEATAKTSASMELNDSELSERSSSEGLLPEPGVLETLNMLTPPDSPPKNQKPVNGASADEELSFSESAFPLVVPLVFSETDTSEEFPTTPVSMADPEPIQGSSIEEPLPQPEVLGTPKSEEIGKQKRKAQQAHGDSDRLTCSSQRSSKSSDKTFTQTSADTNKMFTPPYSPSTSSKATTPESSFSDSGCSNVEMPSTSNVSHAVREFRSVRTYKTDLINQSSSKRRSSQTVDSKTTETEEIWRHNKQRRQADGDDAETSSTAQRTSGRDGNEMIMFPISPHHKVSLTPPNPTPISGKSMSLAPLNTSVAKIASNSKEDSRVASLSPKDDFDSMEGSSTDQFWPSSSVMDMPCQSLDQKDERNGATTTSQNDKKIEKKSVPIPPYTHITKNKYPKCKFFDEKKTRRTHCECAKEGGNCTDGCLNRGLKMECPSNCKAVRCRNQQFERCARRKTSKVEVVFIGDQVGHGLRATRNIKRGKLITEYIGEAMTSKEGLERSKGYARYNEPHHYVLTSDNIGIDATEMGNESRFINHSCNPNAMCEPWIVPGTPGDTRRFGIFALKPIKKGEEITFDYQFKSNGVAQPCLCGSANCREFIGGNQDKKEAEIVNISYTMSLEEFQQKLAEIDELDQHSRNELIQSRIEEFEIKNRMHRSTIIELARMMTNVTYRRRLLENIFWLNSGDKDEFRRRKDLFAQSGMAVLMKEWLETDNYEISSLELVQEIIEIFDFHWENKAFLREVQSDQGFGDALLKWKRIVLREDKNVEKIINANEEKEKSMEVLGKIGMYLNAGTDCQGGLLRRWGLTHYRIPKKMNVDRRSPNRFHSSRDPSRSPSPFTPKCGPLKYRNSISNQSNGPSTNPPGVQHHTPQYARQREAQRARDRERRNIRSTQARRFLDQDRTDSWRRSSSRSTHHERQIVNYVAPGIKSKGNSTGPTIRTQNVQHGRQEHFYGNPSRHQYQAAFHRHPSRQVQENSRIMPLVMNNQEINNEKRRRKMEFEEAMTRVRERVQEQRELAAKTRRLQ